MSRNTKHTVMAKQEGIFPLNGNIDNISFFKTKKGYQARKKSGVSGDRIASDPAFQRTRENNAEFGRACKASKLLRTSLRALVKSSSDGESVNRLSREFVKVIQADSTSLRGQRNVIDGEAELLTGFEFNESGTLTATFLAPFSTTLDRTSGDLSVDIPAFAPIDMIATPEGATHYKIVAGGAAVDFESAAYSSGRAETSISAIDVVVPSAINLTVNVGAASTAPLFLMVGIQFYQETNGQHYLLKNGSFNALAIVAVSGI